MFKNYSLKAFLMTFALGATLGACSVMEGRESVGQYTDDTAITTTVKARLIEDPDVKSLQVGVETMKGVVQLSGFVQSPQLAVRAEEIARGVNGVKGVRNDLVVQ